MGAIVEVDGGSRCRSGCISHSVPVGETSLDARATVGRACESTLQRKPVDVGIPFYSRNGTIPDKGIVGSFLTGIGSGLFAACSTDHSPIAAATELPLRRAGHSY